MTCECAEPPEESPEPEHPKQAAGFEPQPPRLGSSLNSQRKELYMLINPTLLFTVSKALNLSNPEMCVTPNHKLLGKANSVLTPERRCRLIEWGLTLSWCK